MNVHLIAKQTHKINQTAYYILQKAPETTQATADYPLVLLHGFCEDSTIWQTLLPFLVTSNSKRAIIAIDLGGFGQSEQLGNTIESMATQVKEVVEALAISPCILVGHSLGGYVALAFAEYFADNLAGFGLLHSHAFADTPEKQQNRDKSIGFIARNGMSAFVSPLFYQLFAPDFARANTELVEQLIANAALTTPTAAIAASLAMRDRRDRTAVLNACSKPILLISGKQDNAITPAQSLAQAALPTTCFFNWFTHVGHMAMLEEPEKTAQMITEFCAFCDISSSV